MEHVQCIVTVQAQKTWESERGSYVSVVPALMEMWSSGSGHAAPRSSSYTCEKCMMLVGLPGREFRVYSCHSLLET